MMAELLHWILASQKFFYSLGWLGWWAYGFVFFGMQFCLGPVAPLAMAAGLIFGKAGGLIAISIGTAMGVAINFLVARHFARGFIAARIGKNEKFRIIDAAIARAGWKIIALLRLCPLPLGLSNYCYGLTAIPFWPYFITSVIAIVPANMLFVWLGASFSDAAQAMAAGRPRQPMEYVLMGLGAVAALAALTYIGRLAKAVAIKEEHVVEAEIEAEKKVHQS